MCDDGSKKEAAVFEEHMDVLNEVGKSQYSCITTNE